MNFNMQMSYVYTNRICPKYTQIGLMFSFTPTTIKLYMVKVYMKSIHEKPYLAHNKFLLNSPSIMWPPARKVQQENRIFSNLCLMVVVMAIVISRSWNE